MPLRTGVASEEREVRSSNGGGPARDEGEGSDIWGRGDDTKPGGRDMVVRAQDSGGSGGEEVVVGRSSRRQQRPRRWLQQHAAAADSRLRQGRGVQSVPASSHVR
jgi:hypothetical protein